LALNKSLVLCGLDGDTEAKPFGQILDCIPLADSVVKMTALCELCADGTPAIFTGLRVLGAKSEIISVGAAEKYIPLCRKHYCINHLSHTFE
jgi:thymidine kinase